MASQDFLQMRSLSKRGVVGLITTDTPVAIRLKVKKAAGAVTSVTTVTGTSIAAITATGGTETWDFATYDTVAKLAAKINASAYWECKILDALGSDATVTTFVNGAITAGTVDGVSYYDVKVDTSAALRFTYRLTYDRSVGAIKPSGSHRVALKEIKYGIDVGTAAMDNLQVFEIGASGATETQLIKALNVDTTETTVNWASGNAEITAADGNDLVVRIKDAGTLADLAANYLQVTGVLE
jgi:hypothetical protein